MNFLAHIYLSGNSDEIRLGNFIGDYVKGKDYNNYPDEIRKGIILHRKIDTFTDAHPIVRNHKTLFYSKYHKYAGIITDIIYDHFLAQEWQMFSEVMFEEYIKNTYDWLQNNIDNMPLEMKKFVPNFIRNNWLQSYYSIEGIQSVLIGMSKGTSLPAEYEFAIYILRKHYTEFKKDFLVYFPLLIEHAEKYLEENGHAHSKIE
jgi:acyl carrier protein phosphodiesterase